MTGSFTRKAIKAAALPAGILTRRRTDDTVILLYHRVGEGSGEITLSIAAFERQLAMLAERERIQSLDALLEGAGGGVIVTFDDGYRDFYDHVLPLLRRYEVPAVLYLATALVAHGAPGSSGSSGSLTWSHLREALSTGLVTIGAHTHRHLALSGVSEQEAEDEMRRSKELIEDHLGVACSHFAYPFAVGSPKADRAARRLFDTAALDAWKTNRAGQIDPYRLGRVPILRSDSDFFFRAKVRGGLNGEAAAYRAFGRGPWSRS